MNLTEPQAGSDVGALRTRAEPAADGSYRIFGQKIYITYGEHDWSDNIVHLVLARLPDAPAGTRGISLFLVPKFISEADGQPGHRNDVTCASIEHKLGIHGSPTCTMIYGERGDGAVGWLVGEENKGMACMFTMMNNARLGVGMQGVAAAEAATQMAVAFAKERRQGRVDGRDRHGADRPASGRAAHACDHALPDPGFTRHLLRMRACDRHGPRRAGAGCKFWRERADLLTPVSKAFSTDIGVEVASLNVQVHGGMGYIEETGAAAILRDVRIAPIYEGTNGIQAIDLVTRKLPQSDGRHVHDFIDELRTVVARLRGSNRDSAAATADRLARRRSTISRRRQPRCRTCWPTAACRPRLPARRPISGCSGLPSAEPTPPRRRSPTIGTAAWRLLALLPRCCRPKRRR